MTSPGGLSLYTFRGVFPIRQGSPPPPARGQALRGDTLSSFYRAPGGLDPRRARKALPTTSQIRGRRTHALGPLWDVPDFTLVRGSCSPAGAKA